MEQVFALLFRLQAVYFWILSTLLSSTDSSCISSHPIALTNLLNPRRARGQGCRERHSYQMMQESSNFARKVTIRATVRKIMDISNSESQPLGGPRANT